MREFQLIQQIQQEIAVTGEGVTLGIGDDAAILAVPAGKQLVAATDTLNAGVHFPADTDPADIGYKCLAVNLSDLAAMGATPRWALLSLSLPEADQQWLASFTSGFRQLAEQYAVALVGGDTTSGPLSIAVTALGVIEPSRGMLRSNARPGDRLVVSGTIGGAARVLDLLAAGKSPSQKELLNRPQPRVELGQAISPFVHACIDISDGLLADLGHMLDASECAARIDINKLPADEILNDLDDKQRWNYQLAGGDDYELLFCLSAGNEMMLDIWENTLNVPLTVIGVIEEGEGLRCIDPDGTEFVPERPGFDHFGQTS